MGHFCRDLASLTTSMCFSCLGYMTNYLRGKAGSRLHAYVSGISTRWDGFSPYKCRSGTIFPSALYVRVILALISQNMKFHTSHWKACAQKLSKNTPSTIFCQNLSELRALTQIHLSNFTSPQMKRAMGRVIEAPLVSECFLEEQSNFR